MRILTARMWRCDGERHKAPDTRERTGEMMHYRQSTALIAAAVLLAGLALSARNLLTHPGIESEKDGELPTGWQLHGGAPPTLDRCRAPDARTGVGAVLVIDQVGGERTSEAKAGSGIRQRVSAAEGQWYRASCWTQCLDCSGPRDIWLQLYFYPLGKRHNQHFTAAQPGGAWKRVTIMGQAPDGTTHADLDQDGTVELINGSSTGALVCGHSRRGAFICHALIDV